jgi:hypothetical protein
MIIDQRARYLSLLREGLFVLPVPQAIPQSGLGVSLGETLPRETGLWIKLRCEAWIDLL